jgi:predicted phosphatase
MSIARCPIKFSGLAAAALIFFSSRPALADPLKDPKRIVSGGTVDLSPLFQWWPKQKDDRPLAKWSHVTGEIVGTNSWGWILEAHTTVPNPENGERKDQQGKIVLRNPPIHDRLVFDTIFAQRKALEAKKSALNSEAQAAAKHLEQLSDQRKANKQTGASSRGLNAQSARWTQAEKSAKDAVKALDVQLQAIEKQLKPFPNRDRYLVDCFALSFSEKADGLAVFDYGLPLK